MVIDDSILEVFYTKEKDCHRCIHCRVCYLFLVMSRDREMGVFFSDYRKNRFAEICDNYKLEVKD